MYMPGHAHVQTPEILGQGMDRTLAVGATSGSLSAIILRLLSSALDHNESPFECPSCPDLTELLRWEQLDLPSLVLGVFLGVLLGPLLDLLHLVRQSWKVWLQTRIHHLAKEQPLYRLA